MKYDKIEVRIKLTEDLLGTVAMDPKIYSTFIESKKPEDITENESETVEKREERGWTGYHKDENGLFIYNYMIKGFLKEAGDVLKAELGVKNLKSKLTKHLFVKPRRIYLGQELADGVLERPIRASTPQGPRVSLIRSDAILQGKELSFTLCLIPHKELNIDLIKELLEYGQFNGLGQWRSGSYGQFEVVSIK